MTTRLDKTLKREIDIKGRRFVVAIDSQGLKLTLKGRRKGFELQWEALVSGEAALAVALNASVGQFAPTEMSVPKPAKKMTQLTSGRKKSRP
jgi:hypothetical protein